MNERIESLENQISHESEEHQISLILSRHNLHTCESGVRIVLSGNETIMLPLPARLADISCEERNLQAYEIIKKQKGEMYVEKLSEDPIRQEQEYAEAFIAAAESRGEAGGIGGIGITGRNIEVVEKTLQGVTERLKNEKKKVVFLGNGYSNIPLELSRRFKLGELEHPPVIVDLINYQKFLSELESLESEFRQNNLPFPKRLLAARLTIAEMIEQSEQGNLVIVRHQLGDGHIPKILEGAGLAINLSGPPLSTLDEQCSILDSQAGELYTNIGREADIREILERRKEKDIEFQVRKNEEGHNYYIFKKLY